MQNLYHLIGIDKTAQREEIEAAIQRRMEEEESKLDQGDPNAGIALYNLREARKLLLEADQRARYDKNLDHSHVASQPANQSQTDKCQACGGLISKQARTCPHCGQPLSALSPSQARYQIAGSILLLALIYWGIHSWTHREPPTLSERIEALAKQNKKSPQDRIAEEARQRQRDAEAEQARQQSEADAKLPRLGDRTTEAFMICRNHIEARLKSPRSADFPLLDFRSIHLGDERYEVASYVDAKNSFNAEIRTKFWCTLQYTGPRTRGGAALDSGHWQLIKLHTTP